jgi:hypothetical protein
MTTATLGTAGLPAGASDGDSQTPTEALPSWFVIVLVVALAALVGFGTVGLALGVAGAFVPVPTLALGLAVTIALVVAVAPWRFPAARDLATQVPAVLAVALTAGATAFAIRHHAQHVLLDRDPGGYMVTGRWMATHHNLEFHARVGAFVQTTGLKYSSPAVYDRGGGVLYFQFSHLLPALLGQARWIGGDRLMFFTPPILGGLGLLSFYALATRFLRPWIALAALAALATDLVEVHFMRDAYSELPTQAVLLGGLWLLTRRGAPRPAVAAFTGLLLGATVMARIDGPLYLVAIPFVVGAAVLARRRGDADGRAALIASIWLASAVAATTALGLVDVRLRSTKYLHDLGGRVVAQYVGLALACAIAIGVAVWAPRLVTWPVRVARGRLPDLAGVAVAAGLFGAWFLRPHLQETHSRVHPYMAGLQRIDKVPIDATRRYYEDSLVWHSWYLGPLTLAAGIIGIAFLTREVLRGRAGTKGLVVTAFVPVTAVYLANPSIFPDQIWVMRRFLPFIIPGFILGAFVVVDRLLDVRARNARVVQLVARAGAAVLVAAAIAFPIHTVWPVRGDTTQRGFLGSVEQLCDTLGPDAAVIVLQGTATELLLPQTLRSYCNVPVAIRVFDPEAPGLDRAGFARQGAAWKHAGRTLFVVADNQARIDNVVPGLTPVAQVSAFNGLYLREHVIKRPRSFRAQAYTFAVARVP